MLYVYMILHLTYYTLYIRRYKFDMIDCTLCIEYCTLCLRYEISNIIC